MLPFLLFLPLICAAIFFIFSKKICWREFSVVAAVVVVVNVIGVCLSFIGSTHDTEIINGTVEGKSKDRVSCRHSYRCNCYTTCHRVGKTNSCTTHCSTCYEHGYDIDWNVQTSVRDVRVSTVDRQGLQEPPRWSSVQIGEPASFESGYTNYIKAAPSSVLRMTGQAKDFAGLLPEYPQAFDYYRVNHIVSAGVAIPDVEKLQVTLGKINGILGPTKQVNIILVAAKTADKRYLHALEEHWLGGKKNDLIIVLGVPDGFNKIEWAGVMTWSDVELLKIHLRDEILRSGSLTNLPDVFDGMTGLVGKEWRRKPMEDFAYLRYQYSPSPGIMLALLLIGLISSLGLSWYFVNNDPFASGLAPRPYRY
jgi:hypothetical protein